MPRFFQGDHDIEIPSVAVDPKLACIAAKHVTSKNCRQLQSLQTMMRMSSCFIALVVAAQFSHLEASTALRHEIEVKAHLQADPKKAVDLSKPMPLKAQAQGFSGKKVHRLQYVLGLFIKFT